MDCETDLRASRTYHLTAVHGVRNYSGGEPSRWASVPLLQVTSKAVSAPGLAAPQRRASSLFPCLMEP